MSADITSSLNQEHYGWGLQCMKDISSSFYAFPPANVFSAQYTRKRLHCTNLTTAELENNKISYRFLESCIIDYNKAVAIS